MGMVIEQRKACHAVLKRVFAYIVLLLFIADAVGTSLAVLQKVATVFEVSTVACVHVHVFIGTC